MVPRPRGCGCTAAGTMQWSLKDVWVVLLLVPAGWVLQGSMCTVSATAAATVSRTSAGLQQLVVSGAEGLHARGCHPERQPGNLPADHCTLGLLAPSRGQLHPCYLV